MVWFYYSFLQRELTLQRIIRIIASHIQQQLLLVTHLRIMISDVLMNVVLMMIPVQTQVVVIVVAMIKKSLYPLGQEAQAKLGLR
ncbi:MAG: hypothetical protein BGO19_15230 [Acinetobacter sp. 38-8]|nr:MAG: hypothetical protein BGO19_15230 [Acinetobacter sp. 38-8]